ncbi:MAG: hypothetical protein OXH45_07550 [Gammaproteobacteria bacterium]|nr:hypothetical protein [Gammaproteobacteria bacterium]
MRTAIFALLASWPFAAVVAQEQSTYLIASGPYAKYPSSFPTLLYRVEEQRLKKVRTVTTQRQGTMFVEVYPDLGYALIASKGAFPGSYMLDVIRTNSVSTQRSYDITVCPGCAHFDGYMQIRDRSPVYVLRGLEGGEFVYLGIDLDAGHNLSGFRYGDEAEARRSGLGSRFADYQSPWNGPLIEIEDSAAVIYRAEEKLLLDWSAPGGLGSSIDRVTALPLVNNHAIRVISVGHWSSGKYHYSGDYVLDKSSDVWRGMELPGTKSSLRAFGYWVVSEEIREFEPGALDLERLERQRFLPFLSAAESFHTRSIAPSGRLSFYNARTMELVVHETGEPNSEVLYVDGDDVAWYRVSDELRRAPILGDRLGPPELVAKAPELWAVHWLFFGKE